jgi:hypothetical protein
MDKFLMDKDGHLTRNPDYDESGLPTRFEVIEAFNELKKAIESFEKEYEYEYGWQIRNVEGNKRSQWQKGALAGFEHVKKIYDKHFK